MRLLNAKEASEIRQFNSAARLRTCTPGNLTVRADRSAGIRFDRTRLMQWIERGGAWDTNGSEDHLQEAKDGLALITRND